MKINFKNRSPEELLLENPPRSDDAEKGVLSCFLQNPVDLLNDAQVTLPTEAFHHPVHRQLYEELLTFNNRPDHKALDLVTFSQHLIDKGLMDKIGGPAFVAELLSFVPTPAHYPYYRGILRDKLKLRRVMLAACGIITSVVTSQHDLEEVKDGVGSNLIIIQNELKEPEPKRSWNDELNEWREDWDLMASGSKASSMPLRWECWNDDAGGLQAGYSIISGTSSSGKSTLLGNIMVDACIGKKRPGLYVSYEMPVRTVISRLVADIADVDGRHLFQPDRTQPEKHIQRKIADAVEVIRKSPLRIVHIPSLSAEGVCSLARKMFLENGDLILGVDYIQLIPRPAGIEKGATRERELARNSEFIRTFSKEIDRPVIALSQLNADLTTRESASVNNDCDSHFRVDRTKDSKTGRLTEHGIWIFKSRNGKADLHMPIKLYGERFRFVEE